MLVNEQWITKWSVTMTELFRDGTNDNFAEITRLREAPMCRRLFTALLLGLIIKKSED